VQTVFGGAGGQKRGPQKPLHKPGARALPHTRTPTSAQASGTLPPRSRRQSLPARHGSSNLRNIAIGHRFVKNAIVQMGKQSCWSERHKISSRSNNQFASASTHFRKLFSQ
jgi:hypothetical protein